MTEAPDVAHELELRNRWLTEAGARAMTQIMEVLRGPGERRWDTRFDGLPFTEEVKSGFDLRFAPLKRVSAANITFRLVDFTGADLDGCDLKHARFDGCNLSRVRFPSARLTELVFSHSCSLRESLFEDVTFEGNNVFNGCDFGGSLISNTSGGKLQFIRCSLVDTNFMSFRAQHSEFVACDFEMASLMRCDLSESSLNSSVFVRTVIESTDLTNVDFRGVELYRCVIEHVRFGANHLAIQDNSDTIRTFRRDMVLNWGKIRALWVFPVFGVSWSALAISLVVVVTIGQLNEHRIVQFLNYPIPIPDRMAWLLIDSIMLVIGSSIYRLACPKYVQASSETEWVVTHNRPRLIYLREAWKRRRWQWLTVCFTSIGALVAAWLICDRLYAAISYIVKYW